MRGVGKVASIKERILDDIRSGVLQSGDKIFSRHQFMARYKCSRGSIDQAISELCRDGFLYARQGAGTFVAESPAESSSIKTVYLVGNFDRIYANAAFLDPASTASRIQRYADCMLCGWTDLNMNLNKMTRKGTAVIWERPDYSHLMAMDFLNNAGVKQLQLNRIFGDYDYITTDSRGGIAEGLSWLTANAGHRIAYITSRPNTKYPYVAERQLYFFELAIRQAITIPPEWLFMEWPHEREYGFHMDEVVETIFSGPEPCRGIYLDFASWGGDFIHAAARRGLECGKDYFLLTFDGIGSGFTQPGLGMLVQNLKDIDDQIINWLTGDLPSPVHIKIKPQLYINR